MPEEHPRGNGPRVGTSQGEDSPPVVIEESESEATAESSSGEAGEQSRETGAQPIIRELEEKLGCRVIAYYSDTSLMAHWDARPLARLLGEMGPQEEAAVIIQSHGGDADAAHLLSSLVSEYVEHEHVYVPTFAQSAATLFSLGADTLWMGPTSELSPVDPQVPVDPRLVFPMADPTDWPFRPGEPIHLPGHVIRDFLDLAGILDVETESPVKRPRIHPDRLEDFVEPKLNPWILGWYERADKVSRVYARDALVNHLLRGESDAESKAERIVHALLDEHASHGASILRTQARQIGIPVTDCTDEVWALLEKLTDWYQGALRGNIGRVLETLDGFHALPVNPRVECPHCEEVMERHPEFRFCSQCGRPLEEQCPTCEGPLGSGWRFCPRCGTATGSAKTRDQTA